MVACFAFAGACPLPSGTAQYAGPITSIPTHSLRLRRLVWIVKETLVAVGILSDEQPVARVAVHDGNVAGFGLGSQRVERRDLGLVRLGLDVQADEYQTLANLLRPLLRKDECTTPAINWSDSRPNILLVPPRDPKAESVNIEAERSLDSVPRNRLRR
jgi:hypothetical protein